MSALDDAKQLSMNVLLITIFLAGFIAFNGSDTRTITVMITYMVFAGIVIVLINQGFDIELIGDNITFDTFKGVIFGSVLIFLNSLNSAFSIGTPQAFLALGPAEKFLAIVIVAPIIEEFVFRGWLYPMLRDDFFGDNDWFAIPTQGIMFALYHYTVYGGFLGYYDNIGLFIGAFVFACVAAFLIRDTDKHDVTELETPIVGHMMFNGYLLNKVLHFLALVK